MDTMNKTYTVTENVMTTYTYYVPENLAASKEEAIAWARNAHPDDAADVRRDYAHATYTATGPAIEADYDKPFPVLTVSAESEADWDTFALINIPTDVTYVVTLHSGEVFQGRLIKYSNDDPMPARFQLRDGEDWEGSYRTVSLSWIKSLEVM